MIKRLTSALLFAAALVSACSSSSPALDGGAAAPHLGARHYGVYAMQELARVAITAALPAYTASGSGTARILTANANAALASQDGVSLSVGDQVLLTAGAAAADNGLWIVTNLGSGSVPWVLTRSVGYQTGLVFQGMQVLVGYEGTLYGGSAWQLTTSGTITVDTTGTAWVQLPWRYANSSILPSASMNPIHRADAVCTSNQASLSGTGVTCDGVALNAAGLRVLLVNQSTGSQNGIWTIASGSWTRPPDFFTGDGVPTGSLVEIAAGGTTWGESTWKMTSSSQIVIGTGTPAFYPRFSSGTCTLSSGTCSAGSSFWIQSSAQCVASYNGSFSSPGSLRISTQNAGAGNGAVGVTSSSGTDGTAVLARCVNW